jgi:glucokinase
VIAPWLKRFGAAVLVVGGSIARSWDLVAAPLEAGIRHSGPAVAGELLVVPAELPERAPLIGAAWQAEHYLLDNGVRDQEHEPDDNHV